MPCLSTGSRAFARPLGGRLGEVALTRTFIPLVTFGAVVPVSGWGEVPVVRCSHDSKDSTRKKWGNVGERALDKDVHLVIHSRGGRGRTKRGRP